MDRKYNKPFLEKFSGVPTNAACPSGGMKQWLGKVPQTPGLPSPLLEDTKTRPLVCPVTPDAYMRTARMASLLGLGHAGAAYAVTRQPTEPLAPAAMAFAAKDPMLRTSRPMAFQPPAVRMQSPLNLGPTGDRGLSASRSTLGSGSSRPISVAGHHHVPLQPVERCAAPASSSAVALAACGGLSLRRDAQTPPPPPCAPTQVRYVPPSHLCWGKMAGDPTIWKGVYGSSNIASAMEWKTQPWPSTTLTRTPSGSTLPSSPSYSRLADSL